MTAGSAGQPNNFRYKPIDYRIDRKAAAWPACLGVLAEALIAQFNLPGAPRGDGVSGWACRPLMSATVTCCCSAILSSQR